MPTSFARFRTTFLDSKPPESDKNSELIEWCKRFASEGMAESQGEYNAGNLSIRSEHGMIITASGSDLGKISNNHLVEVVECNSKKFELKAVGPSPPSSESFIHWEIYKRRHAVNAVFHGHSELIVRHAAEMELCVTKHQQQYGTIGLLQEILNVLGDRNFIVMNGHGFLSLGQTMQEAGDRAINKLLEAEELEKQKKQKN